MMAMASKCIVTKSGDSSRGTTVWNCREQREMVLATSDYDVGKWLIVDGDSVRDTEPLRPTRVVTIKGVPGEHVIVTVPAVKPPSFEATFGISMPALHFQSPLLGPIDVVGDAGKYPENVLLELDVLKKCPQLKHALLKVSGHSAEWIAQSQDVKLLTREAILSAQKQHYAKGIVVKSAGNHHIIASEQPDGSTRLFVTMDGRLCLGAALKFIGMNFCESVGLAVVPESEWRCLIPTDVANEFRISAGGVTEISKGKIRVRRLGWVNDTDEVVPRDRLLVSSVLLRLDIGLNPLAMNVRVASVQLRAQIKGKNLEPEEYTLTAKLTARRGDMTFFYCPAMTSPRDVFSTRTDRFPDQVKTSPGYWYKMTLRFYANVQIQRGHPAIVLSAVRVKEPENPFATSTSALRESTAPSDKTSSSGVLHTNTENSVGVICYKGVDGCYVYSHKLAREALVKKPTT